MNAAKAVNRVFFPTACSVADQNVSAVFHRIANAVEHPWRNTAGADQFLGGNESAVDPDCQGGSAHGGERDASPRSLREPGIEQWFSSPISSPSARAMFLTATWSDFSAITTLGPARRGHPVQ
jgi:hypothetical protein